MRVSKESELMSLAAPSAEEHRDTVCCRAGKTGVRAERVQE